MGKSTSQVKLPRSIEEATAALEGLGRLLTAKEWERAAIVYAFTDDDVKANQYARSDSTTGMSPREFAALGISGLKSDQTVRTYRKAWQAAIDDGHAISVEPGDTVILPTRQWPPTDYRTGGFDERIVTQVRNAKPEVREIIAKELVTAADVAETVAESVADDPGMTARVASKVEDKRPLRRKTEPRQSNSTTGTLSQVVLLDTLDHAVLTIEDKLPEFTAALRNREIARGDQIADKWRDKLHLAVQLLDDVRSAIV